MTGEVQRMIRGAIGGAALGGAGAVYGGIVGALRGARDERLALELAPDLVRSRAS